MKKIIILLLMVAFLVPIEVKAMVRPNPPGIVVFVEGATNDNQFGFFEMNGHIDLMVDKADFRGQLHTEVSNAYKYYFEAYESFAFLQNEDYISYRAFGKFTDILDFGYDTSYETGYVSFGRFHIDDFGDFKVTHYGEDGEVYFTSDVIDVPEINAYERKEIIIYYNQDTHAFSYDIDVYANVAQYVETFFLVVVIFFLVALIYGLKILLGLLFKLTYRNMFFMFGMPGITLLGYLVLPLINYNRIINLNEDYGFILDYYLISLGIYLLIDIGITVFVMKARNAWLAALSVLLSVGISLYFFTLIMLALLR